MRDGEKWVAGAYFPRGIVTLGKTQQKFDHDAAAVQAHQADGFAFVTNQGLSDSQRKKLGGRTEAQVEVYHLERIASILDSPQLYGVRLEFLDIEMSREEQHKAGVSPEMIRVSVGIEHSDDILADLDQALAATAHNTAPRLARSEER